MLEYVIAIAGIYIGYSLLCLEINYRSALSMRITLVRVPIDPLNVPFQIVEPHLFNILDLAPTNLVPNFVRYMRRGWFFLDKADSHLRYGPIFALVTPRGVHVYTCDSEAIHDIFSRRLDFLRPSENYKLLEVYGPCISTASLTEWPRHRKVLAAPFNESVMNFVWSESLEQTRQMLASFIDPKNASDGIPSVAKDTRTLSLNVLAATGFRRSFNFKASGDETDTDPASLYRDALSTVLDNVILVMLIPHRYLRLPIFPKSLQRVGKAGADFKTHMERMLDEETSAYKQGRPGAGGLMTSFVQALNSHEAKREATTRSQGLSVEEIFGNIFVINFAGHDTTANTLAFSMFLLATEPRVQEWVAEEVQKAAPEAHNWDYGRLFPQLIRCRAILLETLRLFPPIMALPKYTGPRAQRLQVGDRVIIIPPNTSTSPSLLAVHTHPRYWSDPLEWRPSRWIESDNAGREESLITPPRDTYFPWSDGPQNCPGAKFSQVEFVAVLAFLMRSHFVSVVRKEDETGEQARQRALEVVNDCDMQLLLRMRDADRVRLKCEPRLYA